ncbi:ATP-binding protein [Rarobacter faecitabidus]|uniref:ATPase family protein associated with various cellular activities (AAA) n=1 Tax=Rarobacter faecitabidus TaxID=13243 RepID=A0A542ZEF3_RARFA|nr:ATP-binding protein [Rarobacter faecitabidus]TQL58650.1 ATPase family protein associated with various cellular activities (AAA) [Rarobacter faecitabidus]
MTDGHLPRGLTGAARALLAAFEVRAEAGWEPGPAVTIALSALASDLAADVLGSADERFAAISRSFSLDATEERILAVALLAEIHVGAAATIGVLTGEAGAALPTVALGVELLGGRASEEEAWRAIAPTGTLRALGLLELDGATLLSAYRLRPHELLVRRLHGDRTSSSGLAGLYTSAHAIDAGDPQARVAEAIRAGAPLAWIQSPPGAAGLSWAAGVCARLEAYPVAVDLARATWLTGQPDSVQVARLRNLLGELVLDATLDRSPVLLVGAELATPAIDILVEAPIPVLCVADVAWDSTISPHLPVTAVAGRLTSTQRTDCWRDVLGTRDIPREITVLRLTPEQIAEVARSARYGSPDPLVPPTADDLVRVARLLSTRGSGVPSAGRSPATLADLVLPEHTLSEITRLIDWGRYRDDVLASNQLQGKGGKGTGIAALFSGGPGTGKTLSAHVVADSLGMELLQVDLSAIVDKYIGETEKNLERVFTSAESMNCVLFFDEADSLFGSRSAVNDSRDRYANQEVAYLLQRIEAFDGITVLATNLRGNIDTAFARRLHFMIHFPDPDEPTRAQLWRHHLSQVAQVSQDEPIDIAVLARCLEIAGGDIRNIVLAAAYDAVASGEPLTHAQVRVAAARELAKLGRRLPVELETSFG